VYLPGRPPSAAELATLETTAHPLFRYTARWAGIDKLLRALIPGDHSLDPSADAYVFEYSNTKATASGVLVNTDRYVGSLRGLFAR
jgi:hypothetical protein